MLNMVRPKQFEKLVDEAVADIEDVTAKPTMDIDVAEDFEKCLDVINRFLTDIGADDLTTAFVDARYRLRVQFV